MDLNLSPQDIQAADILLERFRENSLDSNDIAFMFSQADHPGQVVAYVVQRYRAPDGSEEAILVNHMIQSLINCCKSNPDKYASTLDFALGLTKTSTLDDTQWLIDALSRQSITQSLDDPNSELDSEHLWQTFQILRKHGIDLEAPVRRKIVSPYDHTNVQYGKTYHSLLHFSLNEINDEALHVSTAGIDFLLAHGANWNNLREASDVDESIKRRIEHHPVVRKALLEGIAQTHSTTQNAPKRGQKM